MPQNTRRIPALRQHQTPKERAANKPGRAFCEVDGKRRYFGVYGSPEAQAAYHTYCAEYIAAGYRVPASPTSCTIAELCLAYWEFAEPYYASSGERDMVRDMTETVSAYYGYEFVTAFGPLKLKVLQNVYIHERHLTRNGVNSRIGRIKRMFDNYVKERLDHAEQPCQTILAPRTPQASREAAERAMQKLGVKA